MDRVTEAIRKRAEADDVLLSMLTRRWNDTLGTEHIRGFQDRWEFFELWKAVAVVRPEKVLELGMYRGLWTYLVAGVCAQGALFVGVDSDKRTRTGREQTKVMLTEQGNRVELVEGVTQDEETFRQVQALMPTVDVLHIDAGHLWKDVFGDYTMYVPLVRPGGLVVLHDTRRVLGPSHQAVNKFWNNLLSDLPANIDRAVEWTKGRADKERGMGIGCLWLKEKGTD